MSTYTTTSRSPAPSERSVLPVARRAGSTLLSSSQDTTARDITVELTLSTPVPDVPGTLTIPVWDRGAAVALRTFIPYSVRPAAQDPATISAPATLPVTLNETRDVGTFRVEPHFPGRGQSINTPIPNVSAVNVFLQMGNLVFTPADGSMPTTWLPATPIGGATPTNESRDNILQIDPDGNPQLKHAVFEERRIVGVAADPASSDGTLTTAYTPLSILDVEWLFTLPPFLETTPGEQQPVSFEFERTSTAVTLPAPVEVTASPVYGTITRITTSRWRWDGSVGANGHLNVRLLVQAREPSGFGLRVRAAGSLGRAITTAFGPSGSSLDAVLAQYMEIEWTPLSVGAFLPGTIGPQIRLETQPSASNPRGAVDVIATLLSATAQPLEGTFGTVTLSLVGVIPEGARLGAPSESPDGMTFTFPVSGSLVTGVPRLVRTVAVVIPRTRSVSVATAFDTQNATARSVFDGSDEPGAIDVLSTTAPITLSSLEQTALALTRQGVAAGAAAIGSGIRTAGGLASFAQAYYSQPAGSVSLVLDSSLVEVGADKTRALNVAGDTLEAPL